MIQPAAPPQSREGATTLPGRPLGLLESVAHLGRCRFVELAAYERLGALSGRCVDPAVGVFLSSASLAHAWRAEALEELLPVSEGLPGIAEATTSPGPLVDRALDACCGAAGAADGAPEPPTSQLGVPGEQELVQALCGALYPAMLAGYGRRLEWCSPACDGPVARTLRRLVADLEFVLASVAAVVASPRGGASPAGLTAVVGALLDEAGGPFGQLGSTS